MKPHLLTSLRSLAFTILLSYIGLPIRGEASPQVDAPTTLIGTVPGSADGATFNATNQLIVCDATSGTIWMYDPTTQITSPYFQFSDGTQPTSAALAPNGDLVVADAYHRQIIAITPTNTVVPLSPPDPRVLSPRQVAVALDGTIYFSDCSFDPNQQDLPEYFWQLDSTGELTPLWSFGAGNKPTGIKVLGSKVYLAVYHGGEATGQIYTWDQSTGTTGLLTDIALYSTNYGYDGPNGIDVAPDGTIYAALYGESSVGVYDSTGRELRRLNIAGPSVTGVALSPDGSSLYVTETSTNNVYQIGLSETSITLSPRNDVLTWHNDSARTGQYQDEFILTPSSIQNNFGLLSMVPVNGNVDGQPLYVNHLDIPGYGPHNVVYVTTENDTVYAIEADSGQIIWQNIVLPTDSLGNYLELPYNTGKYIVGITATPVIDRNIGPNGVIYVVAMSANATANNGGTNPAHQRIHMLDLVTGTDYRNTEVVAQYPGDGSGADGNGFVNFNPAQQRERSALLLSNGILYTSWASMEASPPYSGWMIGYDQITLEQTTVFNTNPNGLPTSSYLPDGSGGSFWNSGAGPAADQAGNIYGITANGPFDTNLNGSGFPTNGDYGDTILKLSSAGGLLVNDYFTPEIEYSLATGDVDLGSGGVVLLPDLTDVSGQIRHLAMGAGKDSDLYIVDRDQMGKFNSTSNHIYQELDRVLPHGMWATGAYFNGTVYYGPTGPSEFSITPPGQLLAFSVTNAMVSPQATAIAPTQFNYPGATPSISANGNTNGIIWAVENGNSANPKVTPPIPHGLATLHAYDATNIANELYNSGDPSRNGLDNIGIGNKFIVPTVANGKVFVGTTYSLAIFGLLNKPTTLQSAASRIKLSVDGTNLDLPLGLTLATATTEPRLGSSSVSGTGRSFQLILNFSAPVLTSNATVQISSQNGSPAQGVAQIVPNQTSSLQVIIQLSQIQDEQRLFVQLQGLQPTPGSGLVLPVNLPVNFLLGDVDGNGVVDATDVRSWSLHEHSTITNPSTTYLAPIDVNGDGLVDPVDYNLITSNIGHSLP